jgi:hypothetical protein
MDENRLEGTARNLGRIALNIAKLPNLLLRL